MKSSTDNDPVVVLSAWSQLPDIEKVTDRLSVKDERFLEQIGRILFERHQTSRFAVTLLHSHFEVRAHEALVESLDRDRRYLIANVRPLAEVEGSQEFAPKSWKFSIEPPDAGTEQLEILTWSERKSLPQSPLSDDDALLIHALANIYRENKVAGIFGMALVGQLPDSGMIWTEGTDFLGRRLVQEQLPVSEVEARNPIKTMWVFDEEGRFLITLGCCLRTRDGKGHTRAPHPAGWPKKPPRTE